MIKHILLFVLVFFCLSANGQTVILNPPDVYHDGSEPSELNMDVFNVDISDCYKVAFSFDFAFSLPWEGTGNMEFANENPGCFGCNGIPNNQNGGCSPCWDFLWTRVSVDGANIFEDLIGEEGTTDADQFGSYSEEFCVDATDLELNLWTQTWSNDESIDITNIMIICYEKDLTLATNSPICDGETLNLDASTTVSSANIDTYQWSTTGGASIDDPSSMNTTATGVSDGEEFTMTITDVDGCTWDESITVVVNPSPTIDITGPSFLCEEQCGTIVITIAGGTGDYDIEFDWMGTAFNLPSVPDGVSTLDICFNSIPGILLTDSGTGQITITNVTTNSGCPVLLPYGEFTLTLSPAPETPDDLSLTECPEPGEFYGIFDLTSLDFTSDAPAGSTFTLYESNGVTVIDPADYNFYESESASLWFTVTNSDGCTSSLTSFDLIVNVAPFLPSAPEIEVCDITDVILSNYNDEINNDPGIIITWHDGIPNIINPSTSEILSSNVSTDLTGIELWVLVDDGTCINYVQVMIDEINCGCPNPAVIDDITAESTICLGNIINLNATLSGGATGGTWTVNPITGVIADDTDPITTFTPNSEGIYTFTFTTNDPDGAGTDCTADVDMVITEVFLAPIAPDNLTLTECIQPGGTFGIFDLTTLNYTNLSPPGSTYTLFGPDMTTEITTGQEAYQANDGTILWFIVTTPDGCISELEMIELVALNILCDCPTPDDLSVGAAGDLCTGQEIHLIATLTNGLTGGTWTISPAGGILADPNSLNTTFVSLVPGIYTPTFTTNDPDGAGPCQALTLSGSFEILEGVDPPTVSNITYCVDDPTVPLTAIGDNLSWYDMDGNPISVPTPDSSTPGMTTYGVTQSNDNCESEIAPIIVTISSCDCPNPVTLVIASDRTSICSGESVNLTAVSTNANNMGTWSASTGVFSAPTALATTYTPPGVGTYIVTYMTIDPDGDGTCTSVSSSLTIEVTSLFTAIVPQPIILCGGQNSVDLTLLDNVINPAVDIYWFYDLAGTNPIIDPAGYMIPTFADTTVYAQAGTGPCASMIIAITINYQDYIFSNPGSIQVCDTETTIDLTSYETQITTTDIITWYEDQPATNQITNPSTYNISNLDPSVVFFSVGEGDCQTQALPIIIEKVPPSTQLHTITLCPGETDMIEAILVSHGDNDFVYTLNQGSILTGCDSIIQVSVISLNPTMSELNLQGCMGSPFTYQGIIFTETDNTGSLTLDNQASNGCDSIINITVDFVDKIEEDMPITLCQDEERIILGRTITSATTTTSILVPGGTLVNGCDSILNVIVTELLPTSSTIQETYCDPNESITVGNDTYDINNLSGISTIPNAVGCDSTVTVMLEYIELDFNLVSDPACMNQTEYNITIMDITATDGPYDISLDGNYIATITESDIPYSISTTNISGTISMMDINGCDNSASYNIDQSGPADAIISQNGYMLSIELTGITEDAIDSIRWMPSDMVECNSCLSTNIDTILVPTQFSVEIFYGEGCIIEDTILAIPLQEEKHVYTFPNIITSIGGNSTFFVPRNDNSTDVVTGMYIYDRWGNLMYSSEDEVYLSNEGGWNGKYETSGRDVVPGVYIFLVKIKSSSDVEEIYTGDVTVYD